MCNYLCLLVDKFNTFLFMPWNGALVSGPMACIGAAFEECSLDELLPSDILQHFIHIYIAFYKML